MIKVAIVDDHKMFREGVRAILEDSTQATTVWTSSNIAETMEKVKQELPEVMLMDIGLGEESGFVLIKLLLEEFPELKVIALSMHYEESYIVKMLELGAKGYLLKDAGVDEMLRAISTVHGGSTYYSNYVSEVLIKHISKGTKPKDKTIELPLTKREIEILALIAQEYSNPEIAKELFISIRTVDTHRRNLLDKLQVKNTAGLVKKAIKYGIVEL